MLSGCTVDVEELQEAITDSFNPAFNIPINQPSFTRIYEIRSADTSREAYRVRFSYESNAYYKGANLKYIRNSGACNSWFAYLNWGENDAEYQQEAFTGTVPETFNPLDPADLESFISEADKWLFSYTNWGELEQVSLESEPRTYRRFTYNPTGDFYDSIIDYEAGRSQRILKYQYAEDTWGELMRILELDHSGETTAVYTYEYETGNESDYGVKNPFNKSRLIAVPNAQCSYLYLHGPLWAWHYPFPVKKLFKDGVLVYEAFYHYDEAGFPARVEYFRRDDAGNRVQFSEDLLSEVLIH